MGESVIYMVKHTKPCCNNCSHFKVKGHKCANGRIASYVGFPYRVNECGSFCKKKL